MMGPNSGQVRRPRVHVVDRRAFVYDAASAAMLLSEHRIWTAPVGVRHVRNKSPEHNLPCVLSQEQAALVVRRNLVDVTHYSSFGEGHLEHDGDERGVDQKEEQEKQEEEAIDTSRLDWVFPRTPAEKRSMAVFEDLWAKGLCAVCGDNYGADFVIYDGPPTERHSAAAVLVGRGTNDELSPAEVSGFARVQQAVGKLAIIATATAATNILTSASTGTWVAGGEAAGALVGVGAMGGASALRSDRTGSIGVVDQHTGSSRHPPESATPTSGGVRYITLQFHSVSSRT